MAGTKTSKARSHRSHTKTRSLESRAPRPSSDRLEDLGYFYDTIHGRVAFADLPLEFLPALRVALASPALNRLTRINQLGHASLTYFSATQTRFSHAIGTLLMMNRLFSQVWPDRKLPRGITNEISARYPDVHKLSENSSVSVRCHLLLAALYQDCGELPFQKITSLYFRPHSNELDSLIKKLLDSSPESWKTKDVFTLRILYEDLQHSDLKGYDIKFLAFLITGDGSQPSSPLQILRQMLDGTIDADRLDYVFRDALLTIGSLNSAETVLHSIVRYERDHVVVNDPRPAADFLSTRARLWTFVYTSPDVRFRQALLKSFLQAGFSTEDGRTIFREEGFVPEVTLGEFLLLDDHSMLQRIRSIKERRDFDHILEFGRNACEGLLRTVTDHECRILPKPDPNEARSSLASLKHLPNDLFFDLLLDHDEEHRLYIPKSIRVEQSLTEDFSTPGGPIYLEECSGSLGPILSSENRPLLVRDSFFLFRPKEVGNDWAEVNKEIGNRSLFEAIDREDVRREIASLDDTWHDSRYRGKKIAISCAFEDRPTITRIIRELQKQKQRYRVLLDSLLGLGNTALENSRKLIQEAEAVLVIASRAYITSATDKPGANIDAEVNEICLKNTSPARARVVVLPVDSYETLKNMPKWTWAKLNPKWASLPPILYGPLRYAGETKLRNVVKAAIQDLKKGDQ